VWSQRGQMYKCCSVSFPRISSYCHICDWQTGQGSRCILKRSKSSSFNNGSVSGPKVASATSLAGGPFACMRPASRRSVRRRKASSSEADKCAGPPFERMLEDSLLNWLESQESDKCDNEDNRAQRSHDQ
jgi:hypothetical protein